MNRNSSFVISEFTNPSGAVVFRVSGYLDGQRVRKNFRTRSDANAECQLLELKRLQSEVSVRATLTRLSDDELREAESVFLRLKGLPKRLSFYVDYAIANYREPVPSRQLPEAIAAYVAKRRRDHERDLLSACQLHNIVRELKVLEKRFPNRSIASLAPSELVDHCERNAGSLKSYNLRRAILSTFFKFARQSEWLETNPIEKVAHHRIAHRRGSAVTLSASRSAEVMEFVETLEGGALVPYFALCLFAGIRPNERHGEIAKLKPEFIRFDTGVILIEPEVSKVRMPRRITIQPNLAAWLRAYPFEPVDTYFIDHHRKKVTRHFNLSHDVLRHTFVSMFVAKFRSMGEAALQAGNSETIIRKHYLDLKTKEEAEAFFSILPKHRAIPEASTDAVSQPIAV